MNLCTRQKASQKKKVNDGVQKKPRTKKKTDKQRKENDGVLKKQTNNQKKSDKDKTEQCCMTLNLLQRERSQKRRV